MPTIGEEYLFNETVTFVKAPVFLAGIQAGSYPRSSLVTDALAEDVVPLQDMLVTGTGARLGTAAGTPSGAFGLTVGTHGSASPVIAGEAANNNSKTNKLRFIFALPVEYVAAGAVHIRVRAKIDGNVFVAQTLDLTAYLSDEGGGVGADLCTTTVKTLTASYVDYAFAINAAGLSAGDVLDIEITGVADDTGGTANKAIYIGKISVLCDIKG